jgi:peptide/nickel transport system permease protein
MIEKTRKSTSIFKIYQRKFFQKRYAKISWYIVIFLVFIAIFAPFIANNKPYIMKYNHKIYFPLFEDIFPFSLFIKYPELRNKRIKALKVDFAIYPPIPYSPYEYNLDDILLPPSRKHLLGTDDQGRDILARIIYGTRISLSVGIVAVSIYTIIGIILGIIAGYFGGIVDMIISRLIEVMMCFPVFFLILTVLAFLGPSIYNIMLVIGLTGWTGIARIIRGEVLRFRNQEFVLSARAIGSNNLYIMSRHILPNAIPPVLVSVSFGIASAILVESSLSFLGFGVQPPTPSWGSILAQSRDYMDIAWWLTIFPGAMIFITITAYNLIGQAIQDILKEN